MSRRSDFRFNTFVFFSRFFFNQALIKGVIVFLWGGVEVMRGTVEGAEPGSLMGGGGEGVNESIAMATHTRHFFPDVERCTVGNRQIFFFFFDLSLFFSLLSRQD